MLLCSFTTDAIQIHNPTTWTCRGQEQGQGRIHKQGNPVETDADEEPDEAEKVLVGTSSRSRFLFAQNLVLKPDNAQPSPQPLTKQTQHTPTRSIQHSTTPARSFTTSQHYSPYHHNYNTGQSTALRAPWMAGRRRYNPDKKTPLSPLLSQLIQRLYSLHSHLHCLSDDSRGLCLSPSSSSSSCLHTQFGQVMDMGAGKTSAKGRGEGALEVYGLPKSLLFNGHIESGNGPDLEFDDNDGWVDTSVSDGEREIGDGDGMLISNDSDEHTVERRDGDGCLDSENVDGVLQNWVPDISSTSDRDPNHSNHSMMNSDPQLERPCAFALDLSAKVGVSADISLDVGSEARRTSPIIPTANTAFFGDESLAGELATSTNQDPANNSNAFPYSYPSDSGYTTSLITTSDTEQNMGQANTFDTDISLSNDGTIKSSPPSSVSEFQEDSDPFLPPPPTPRPRFIELELFDTEKANVGMDVELHVEAENDADNDGHMNSDFDCSDPPSSPLTSPHASASFSSSFSSLSAVSSHHDRTITIAPADKSHSHSINSSFSDVRQDQDQHYNCRAAFEYSTASLSSFNNDNFHDCVTAVLETKPPSSWHYHMPSETDKGGAGGIAITVASDPQDEVAARPRTAHGLRSVEDTSFSSLLSSQSKHIAEESDRQTQINDDGVNEPPEAPRLGVLSDSFDDDEEEEGGEGEGLCFGKESNYGYDPDAIYLYDPFDSHLSNPRENSVMPLQSKLPFSSSPLTSVSAFTSTSISTSTTTYLSLSTPPSTPGSSPTNNNSLLLPYPPGLHRPPSAKLPLPSPSPKKKKLKPLPSSYALSEKSQWKLAVIQYQHSLSTRGLRHPGFPPSPLGPNWEEYYGRV